ncbi:MAG: hypothetical protein A2314_05205 [Elusimicrobia bacterium RIFOXYB2_FULL_50_12]|nr:MAG: hypothetical protein A2314_05205 [Elusimicrobia bacterium RIFOXYB2_FULL_50_12]
MRKIITLFLLLSIVPCVFAGDAVDENELFGDPDGGIEPRQEATADAAGLEKTTRLSGEITSAVIHSEVNASTSSQLAAYVLGNLFLDVRLKNDIKAMVNLEASYIGSSKTTLVNIREFFFDFNIRRKAYFRTGKQVLQWGRCYFWNPTDLLNVEKKSFVQKIGYREGAYGIKAHIPFGTQYNIYGFIDTGNAQESRDAAVAGKFEFLAGNTEMAFAGWGKRGFPAALGYDLSTRMFGIDTLAEVSASPGDISPGMREDANTLYLNRSGEWTSKAAVSLGRSFDMGDINDRFSIISEFFYNQAGYDGDPFNDSATYNFAQPAVLTSAAGTLLVTSGTKKDFLLYNNLYETHYFSKYYSAIFASIRRFIITDMTLNLNYIRNLSDSSGIISAGVQYKDINDFSYSLLFNSYVGNPNREYTFSNTTLTAQLTAGISF